MTPEQRKEAQRAIRTWAREQPGIGMAEAYVLEQMAFLADPAAGNACFPSATWVAKRCRIKSEKNVRLIWARLEAHGLISGQARPGQPTLWTMNMGVTVAEVPKQRAPRKPRSKRPASPVAATGVEPRSLQPATPVKTTGLPGHGDRGTPVRMTDKGKGPELKEKGREEPGPDRHTALGGKPPEPQPQLPNGERRTAARAKTALWFPVRDDTFDAAGKRHSALGDYALTEGQLWQWAQDFPVLAADPASGIEYTLKRAREWLRQHPDSQQARANLAPWLARQWLQNHDDKLRRANGRQQLPLTTEVA